MGFFDFLKSKTRKPSFDLSDFKFISDDHVRYLNGKEVTGHNQDCWRGIRVQNNISDRRCYNVTIYDLDVNHSLWSNNIQMTPKQMKIIEQNTSHIRLRGYGTDKTGDSFEDYGLTLHINNQEIEKITMHVYDRSVDIVYFKASNHQPQQSQPAIATQTIPTPSTNIHEIKVLSQEIHYCKDLETLRQLYNQKGNYNHPQICYEFGTAFLNMDDKDNAKKAFTQGAIYGIQYPCALYGDVLIEAVGQCLSLLMTKFPIADKADAIKVTALGYIYLSRSIALNPENAYDSYRTRGLLFKEHENKMVVRSLITDNVGLFIFVEPYIISDFYITSQAKDTPYKNLLQIARRIHRGLEDTTIGLKDADEYSLDEMADLGEKQHQALFRTLEEGYKNGQFNLTIEQLISANR